MSYLSMPSTIIVLRPIGISAISSTSSTSPISQQSPEFKDSLNTSLLKRNLRCHGFVTDGQKKFLFQLAQLCLLKKEQANITRFLVVAFEDTHTLLITQKLQNPSNHFIYFTEFQLTRY